MKKPSRRHGGTRGDTPVKAAGKAAGRVARQTGKASAKASASARGQSDPLRPKTARGEATRRAILGAAEIVIGRQGYSEASIGSITRQAGVAQGSRRGSAEGAHSCVWSADGRPMTSQRNDVRPLLTAAGRVAEMRGGGDIQICII